MLTEQFDAVLDDEMWLEVAAVGGGFLAAGAAQSALEGALPWSVPNEVYGIVVALAAMQVDIPYAKQMAMGGGLNTLDAAAQRVGIQESVAGFGGE